MNEEAEQQSTYWTTIIIKRGLKSQERVLCLLESKEVRCLQKWSLRPIANI